GRGHARGEGLQPVLLEPLEAADGAVCDDAHAAERLDDAGVDRPHEGATARMMVDVLDDQYPGVLARLDLEALPPVGPAQVVALLHRRLGRLDAQRDGK